MSTQIQSQTPAKLTALPRKRARFSQLWQFPTLAAGVLTLVLVAAGGVWQHDQAYAELQNELTLLRERLLHTDGDAQEVLPLAETLVDRSRRYTDLAGSAHLLLGMALLRAAGSAPAEDIRDLRSLARAQLEQAETRGVPAEQRPQLWYQLGKLLYQSGGEQKQVICYLSRSLPEGAENPAEGYSMLVQTYLKLPNPDIDAALRCTEEQIKLTGDEETLTRVRLLQGELLVRKQMYEPALQALERIGTQASASIRKRALYLRALCAEEQKQWAKAAPLWQELLLCAEDVPGGKRRILYTLGNCYWNVYPRREAEARQAWQQAKQEGGAEGQAAAILLAEIALHATPPSYDLAFADLQHALQQVKTPRDYQNRLLDLPELLQILRQALTAAIEQKAFAPAEQLAQLCLRVEEAGAATEQLAQICRTWADYLDKQAELVTREEAVPLLAAAKVRWQQAAQNYQQAVQLRPRDQQMSLLWSCIQAYRHAGENARVAALLQQYVLLPLTPRQRAEGWYLLAETQLELGQRAEAHKNFFKCLEYPDSTWAYRARYQLAVEKIREERYDQARQILEQNLSVTSLELDRPSHEKSLYKLAILLYQRGEYAQAYLYLKEATRQYPDHPDVFFVRDLLGDTYRKLAKQESDQLVQAEQIPSQALVHARRQRLQWLEQAHETYQKLEDSLRDKKYRAKLTAKEQKLLGKTTFVVADIQYDMNNFTESLRQYQQLTEEYKGRVEELIACQRIWRCLIVMSEPAQQGLALTALRQVLPSAQNNLARIPEEQFQHSSNWSRQDWQRWLSEVNLQLSRRPSTSSTTTRSLRPAYP